MRTTTRTLFLRAFPALLPLALCGTAGAQVTLYVDDDGPGDPWPGVSVPGTSFFSDPLEDGSAAHPFDDVCKAVAAASNGDTVLVLPSNVNGSYVLNDSLDMAGKAITVTTAGGPEVTALDGTMIPGSSGVLFTSGEGPATVFEGFTLQSFERGSSAGENGGGMYVSGASPTIRDCHFVDNHAYDGGGVFAVDSSARYEDCVFIDNSAWQGGAGAFSLSGSPVYVRCTFDSNVANLGAGALLRSAGGDYMQLSDCLFVGNQSAGYGGALAKLDAGRLEVQRTSFVGNVSGTDGGAVSIWEDGFFHECIFNANSAANGTILKRGGGIADVFGSTLVNNQGGALVNAGGLVVLRNSISWNNSPFEIGAGVGVTYSNVLGGAAGIGSIDADPRFRDALGQDGIPGTLDDDLTLLKNSPCIDAGDTLELHKGPVWANPIPYPVDFAGAPRAVDHPGRPDTGVPSLGLTVDMGAFEFQPATRNCNQVVNPTTYP